MSEDALFDLRIKAAGLPDHSAWMPELIVRRVMAITPPLFKAK
jgi:hypothetical protein